MEIKYENRVIEQLGSELITTDEVAIVELLKNAYDAGSKQANLFFLDSIQDLPQDKLLTPIDKQVFDLIATVSHEKCMVLEDIGHGMDEKSLQNGFFTIGSRLKQAEKESLRGSENTNMILGEKGLGRLAAQRLGPILYIETSTGNTIYCAKVHWKSIVAGTKQIEVKTFKNTSLSTYTRLWFLSSMEDEQKVNFENLLTIKVEKPKKQLFLFPELDPDYSKPVAQEALASAISFLNSPFEEHKNNMNNFHVALWYNSMGVELNFHTKDYFEIAENRHEFNIKSTDNGLKISLEMHIKPWYIEHIHFILLGRKLYGDFKKDHTFYNDLYNKYKDHYDKTLQIEIELTDENLKKYIAVDKNNKNFSDTFFKSISAITPIKGEVFSFKREKVLLTMAAESAIANGFIKKTPVLNLIPDFLRAHNGIKLYRNKFRIANLGDKDSDWLHLQQERTKGQQFFRFELGNTLGYVNISDPFQDYIKEVTSRQDTGNNIYKQSLSNLLHLIFNKKFYEFNRSAYYITKNILEENNLLPEDTTAAIQKEVDKSDEIVKNVKKELKLFQDGIQIINENIALDSEEKIEKIKQVFEQLNLSTESLENNLTQTLSSITASKQLLEKAKQREKNIEEETYNNYKLMANGLITEMLTHELHAILSRINRNDHMQEHLKEVDDYLFEPAHMTIYEEHFLSVKKFSLEYLDDLKHLHRYYDLIEKTFIQKDSREAIINENVKEYLETLEQRLHERFKKENIDFDISNSDLTITMPKGALIHIFYNLIDNSFYWIGQRRERAAYDKSYETIHKDVITIEKFNDSTIYYYDSGTGVLAQNQYNLFHPLVSGKENGRGMGLYIVQKFLESFGGSIELLEDLNQYGNRYIFAISFTK